MLLAKPLTYMNLSGDAVAALVRYFDVAADDLLVVVDEAALPFGRLRARARGSAGGHNGLKSVIERLGTTEFSRLRLGVGRGDGRRDLADHVLAKFERGEQCRARNVHHPGGGCRRDVCRGRHLKVMNMYNPDAAASGRLTDSLLLTPVAGSRRVRAAPESKWP